MRALRNRLLWTLVLTGGAVLPAACSKPATENRAAETRSPAPASTSEQKPIVPPSVSIGESLPVLETGRSPKPPAAAPQPGLLDADLAEDLNDPEEPLVEPSPGTPEWLIREITKLQSAPLSAVQSPVPGQPGKLQVVELTEAQIEAEEMRRAELTIEHALSAIAQCKDDKTRQLLFNNAVHYLANARMTLASYGDHDQIRLLGEEAEVLYQRDPKSFAAVEVQLKLVESLAELAEQEGRRNDQWAVMTARQARLFASRFPQESSRCALALVSAARACEVAGRFDDARQCFVVLEKDYRNTPFAEQAAGAIRRYRLVGQPLGEFGGATIDGGFVSADEFRGRPLLIVFWSAESPTFRTELSRLKAYLDRNASRNLAVLGVNMDVEESLVDQFLEESALPWRTIFFSSLDQRGIRNPLARAFGVTTVPQYWLVDAQGIVRAAPVNLSNLEQTPLQTAEGSRSPAR